MGNYITYGTSCGDLKKSPRAMKETGFFKKICSWWFVELFFRDSSTFIYMNGTLKSHPATKQLEQIRRAISRYFHPSFPVIFLSVHTCVHTHTHTQLRANVD